MQDATDQYLVSVRIVYSSQAGIHNKASYKSVYVILRPSLITVVTIGQSQTIVLYRNFHRYDIQTEIPEIYTSCVLVK